MTLLRNEAVAAGEISRPLTRRAPPDIDPETLLSSAVSPGISSS